MVVVVLYVVAVLLFATAATLFIGAIEENSGILGLICVVFALSAGLLLGTANIVKHRNKAQNKALTQLHHDGWKLKDTSVFNKPVSTIRVAPCVIMELRKFNGHYYVATKRNAPGGGYNVIKPSIQPILIAACNGKVTK